MLEGKSASEQESLLLQAGIKLVDGEGFDKDGKLCYRRETYAVNGIIGPWETKFFYTWKEVER